jgi:hypothetical protein
VEPSALESLPAEILGRIAELATERFHHDQRDAGKAAAAGSGKGVVACCCGCVVETGSGAGHVRGVAKEVEALAGTSRRLRAVLVNAGFFGMISVDSDVHQLFARSVVATEGFLENAK